MTELLTIAIRRGRGLERRNHRPFGVPDRHRAFTPARVAIETGDGTVVAALEQPRASLAGHTAQTIWNTLQLASFAAAATWARLTQQFSSTPAAFAAARRANAVSWVEGTRTGTELSFHLSRSAVPTRR